MNQINNLQNKLPNELLQEISSFLNTKDKARLESISKAFHQLFRDNSFWNLKLSSKTLFMMQCRTRCECNLSKERMSRVHEIIIDKTRNDRNLCQLILKRCFESIKKVAPFGFPFYIDLGPLSFYEYKGWLDPDRNNGILREPLNVSEEEKKTIKQFEDNHYHSFLCEECSQSPDIEDID